MFIQCIFVDAQNLLPQLESAASRYILHRLGRGGGSRRGAGDCDDLGNCAK